MSERQNKTGSGPIQLGDGSTSKPTGKKPATTPPQKSLRSEPPSKSSNAHWRQPRTAREFASQVNAVSTQVLNGAIDPKLATLYSGMARTVAQMFSTQVTQARFAKQVPDLTMLGEDELFDD